jgi:hypothetical protein
MQWSGAVCSHDHFNGMARHCRTSGLRLKNVKEMDGQAAALSRSGEVVMANTCRILGRLEVTPLAWTGPTQTLASSRPSGDYQGEAVR